MNHFGLKKASLLPELRQIPPNLPSIIFPLGPPSCGDECRAERALGCGRIFPCGQQAGATVRKRRREGNARGGAGNDSGRESVHDTNLRSVGEQNRCQVGPTILLRAPRQDPPLLPSIIFPLGPPSCGDECRAERALGCGRIFPCGQQAGATVRKRRREGNARAAQGTTRVENRYTIQTCDPSVSRTAVRWGPQFFFERPAKIARSFLRSSSLCAF